MRSFFPPSRVLFARWRLVSSCLETLEGFIFCVGGAWAFLIERRGDGCSSIIGKKLGVGYSALPPDGQFIFHCPRRLLPGGPCEARMKMPWIFIRLILYRILGGILMRLLLQAGLYIVTRRLWRLSRSICKKKSAKNCVHVFGILHYLPSTCDVTTDKLISVTTRNPPLVIQGCQFSRISQAWNTAFIPRKP